MEQRLKLYRNHTPACVFGYTKPIYEGDSSAKDCSCRINAVGYLKNEVDGDGKPKRIRHRSVDTKDWNQARQTRDQWIAWGQTTKPLSGIEKLRRADVTVAAAVEMFKDLGAYQDTKGENTDKKYKVLLDKRLLPWCGRHGISMIKEFDDPVIVTKFFMSWRNLQPVRGKEAVQESNVQLGTTTKRAEIERYRSFLEFCLSQKWIKTNHAKTKGGPVRVGATEITKKYAPTIEEFNDITRTLENWKGTYMGHDVAKEQLAFCMCLAFTGQRISDVVMFNEDTFVCEDGQWFAELTQIKSGAHVKVPVETWLIEMMQALPFVGEAETKMTIKPSRYRNPIQYGRKFWFWRLNGTTEESTSHQTNAKNYSDKVSAILRRTIAERKTRVLQKAKVEGVQMTDATAKRSGDFEHHMTPHCFRHWFAAMHLQNGVDIRVVAEWLGHANEDVTRKHYSHYNSDAYRESARQYNVAMDKMRGKLSFSRFATFGSGATARKIRKMSQSA